MSLKKFGRNDILLNTMKAHPKCEFFIFNSQINYNNIPAQSGAFSAQVRNVPPGFISLYEYNIDKITGSTAGIHSRDNSFIYPFITKGSARASFRTAVSTTTPDEWGNSDATKTLYGAYPLSASITREYITTPSASSGTYTKHYLSLRNRLNFYGARSIHYKVSSSYGNKDTQTLNLISIPSIFYGTTIQTGSVSLKYYITGSLVAELRDEKQNGELIQVTGSSYAQQRGSGSVAGVVLYDEGIILLTGSWAVAPFPASFPIAPVLSTVSTGTPSWLSFAAGAQDGMGTRVAGMAAVVRERFSSGSFGLSFRGTTETQVVTMFAHAKRGEINYSNNPTFIKYGQDLLKLTSSHVYEENSERLLANTVSSSYNEYSASFKRQVYISKVAIYDDHKNLIGIATLANPVLKEEDQDLAFKLRIDI
jgi:hypothetical protein